jgi:hypothetical protein
MELDQEEFFDRTADMVMRVRAAKESAQRKIEAFGDISEYEVSAIQGQKKTRIEGDEVNQSPDSQGLAAIEGPASEKRANVRQTTLEFGTDNLGPALHGEE